MRFLIFAIVAVMPVVTSTSIRGESVVAPRDGIAPLADRLKTGLRVQKPRDAAFIDTVAARVQDGRIPERLVDSTYSWAISRGKKYPFPAFEYVIRLKAEKLGVPLEAP